MRQKWLINTQNALNSGETSNGFFGSVMCSLQWQASFRNTNGNCLIYTPRNRRFVYPLQHSKDIQRVQVHFQVSSLHIYVQVALPRPYEVGCLGKNVQHTSKSKDIQNKREGESLMDHATSEQTAISEWTNTVFAPLETT